MCFRNRFLSTLFVPWFFSAAVQATLPLGAVPQVIKLEGEKGGRLDSTSWSSGELKGKVHVVFYVSPGEKKLNDDAKAAIKAQNFPEASFASVGIVNLAAAWYLPNSVIVSQLKEAQLNNPRTLLIKDTDKLVVKAWNLQDKSNDVLVFNKQGQVVFSVDGKLTPQDIETLIKVVKANL